MAPPDETCAEDFRALVSSLETEFPGFRIVHKRGDTLSAWIDRVLRVLTFGGQREYMTRYHTVIGNTVYVPERWDATLYRSRVITLRHERVHLRQRRRYGDVVMTFLYLIPLFPLGLAYGRARIEWEAYTETIRATWELEGPDAARAPMLRAHIVRQFTSGAYGWMWPFSATIEKWYERVLEDLDAERCESRSMQSDQQGEV